MKIHCFPKCARRKIAFFSERILTDISDSTLNCLVFYKDQSTKQRRQFLLHVLSENPQLQNSVFMPRKTKKNDVLKMFSSGKKCLELSLRVKFEPVGAFCRACNATMFTVVFWSCECNQSILLNCHPRCYGPSCIYEAQEQQSPSRTTGSRSKGDSSPSLHSVAVCHLSERRTMLTVV